MVRYKQGEVPPLTSAEKAELKALAERPDSETDFSDIPELDDGFLQRSWLLNQKSSHDDWLKDLVDRMIEGSKRMQTDPDYRRYIQSMTH